MSNLSDRDYRARFYAAVDQRQGADERQRRYYVPIYDRPELAKHDVVATLRDAIDFTVAESVQLLSGFRGSGKTSELLRLRDQLDAAGYKTVYLDIEDYFNTELPMDLGAFPIALAAGFAGSIGERDREPVGRRLLEFVKRLQLEPKLKIDTPAGVSIELAASLRDDESFRHEIATAIRSNRRSFRQGLHQYFREVAAAVSPDRGTVFLVDSIDHFRGRLETFHQVRESVERAFSELTDELCLPGLHVVYTVPIYVKSPLGVRHDILNLKVADKDGSPFAPGIEAMTEVLTKRAPEGDLDRLTGGRTGRLIQGSGGLFRDLLRLPGQVLLNARTLPADDDAFSRAELTLRSDYEMALTREHVDLLRGIATSHEFVPAAEEWSSAYDLIASGAVLRYPNGQLAWYGVHPLLEPLL
jgi:hypothetical protein